MRHLQYEISELLDRYAASSRYFTFKELREALGVGAQGRDKNVTWGRLQKELREGRIVTVDGEIKDSHRRYAVVRPSRRTKVTPGRRDPVADDRLAAVEAKLDWIMERLA